MQQSCVAQGERVASDSGFGRLSKAWQVNKDKSVVELAKRGFDSLARRAGWSVDGGLGGSGVDPVAAVRRDWYDVVGFTVGSLEGLEPLARAIESVRRQSLNRCVSIIAGGPVFAVHPDAWERIAADEIITDGASAPRMAERLVCGQPHA